MASVNTNLGMEATLLKDNLYVIPFGSPVFIFIPDLNLFFILINVDVRVSLHASQLILQALKLTTI